jgi:hypothetical protein
MWNDVAEAVISQNPEKIFQYGHFGLTSRFNDTEYDSWTPCVRTEKGEIVLFPLK